MHPINSHSTVPEAPTFQSSEDKLKNVGTDILFYHWNCALSLKSFATPDMYKSKIQNTSQFKSEAVKFYFDTSCTPRSLIIYVLYVKTACNLFDTGWLLVHNFFLILLILQVASCIQPGAECTPTCSLQTPAITLIHIPYTSAQIVQGFTLPSSSPWMPSPV